MSEYTHDGGENYTYTLPLVNSSATVLKSIVEAYLERDYIKTISLEQQEEAQSITEKFLIAESFLELN